MDAVQQARTRASIRRGKYRKYVKSGAWKYNEKYDAYFSVRTRKWVEGKCASKVCRYCAERPELAPK